MVKRKKDEVVNEDLTKQLEPLIADDSYLTDLSLGTAPEGDALADLFMELREDVMAPMPPAPVIEGAELEPQVISLADVKRRRRANPWLAGLVGAAAATVALAGSGAVIHAANPGDPLYGARSAIFGSSDTSVVELASTLEEIQSRAESGDIDGTRELLEQARKQLADAESRARENGETARVAATSTVTETATVTTTAQPKDAARDKAFTETVREPVPTTVYEQVPTTQYVPTTVVTTEYAVAANPLPTPDRQPTQQVGSPQDLAGNPQQGLNSTGGTQTGGSGMAAPQVEQ